MVESLRNGPNIGSSTVYDKKDSRLLNSGTSASVDLKASFQNTANVDVDLSFVSKVKNLSSEPPVNIELVNEIRQKLSEGRYPIDLDVLSSKIFESIKSD